MQNILDEFEAKKQELNCGINVMPVITYLDKILGPKKTRKIIEPIGLPITFLSNSRNWVSYTYYIELLKKLVEAVGDEHVLLKISSYEMSEPKNIFGEMVYSTYSSLFLGSPKFMYRIVFSKNLYKRYTKIGDFEVLSASKNSATISYTLKKGYKQHKYNCMVIHGYITAGPINFGLPPAKVTHKECSAHGAKSCIYEVTWESKRNIGSILTFLSLIALVGIESALSLIHKFFSPKDILITFLSYVTIMLLIKSTDLFRQTKRSEVFDYEKKDSIIKALEKIEHDYNEILATKIQLEERTVFLSIINEINEHIAKTFSFNKLLYTTCSIILDRLKYSAGCFYQYNNKTGNYEYLFNQINANRNGNEEETIKRSVVSKEDFLSMKEKGNIIYLKNINKNNKPSEVKTILEELKKNKVQKFYFLPVDVNKIYSGFFLLCSKNSKVISDTLTIELFDNISNMLQTGYQKILSRVTIENILSSIPSCVIIFSIENYNIRYVNDIFISSFPTIKKKSLREDIINKNLFSILNLDEDVKKNILENISSLKVGEESPRFETAAESMTFEYSLFGIPQFMEGEIIAGIIMIDITEAKYFQQKLLLNEKLLSLGKAASGIAHEINNPLYAALSNAEEIAELVEGNKEVEKYSEEIVNHVMTVSNIVKDLSAYSKTLRKEEHDDIDINSVIEDALKIVKYSSNFLQVKVKKEFGSIPLIKAARGEIQQVFINLFNNSMHAMDGKGTIKIKSQSKSNNIIIEFSDTGKGIPKDVIPHIFDLYFTTKDPDSGTGQGLHIVKKILGFYNAKINVKSTLNKGTTFIITIKI